MIRRAVLLACLALLAGAGHTHAQRLDETMDRLAAMWSRGDVRGITGQTVRSDFALELRAAPSGPVGSRQAAAALRRLFEEGETVSVRPGMTRVVGGTPTRAFGEMQWVVRPRGTTIPERRTVFVALIREDAGWRITEIRVMP